MEQAIILGGGCLTFIAHAGLTKSPSVFGFIQGEAAPYFTTTYMVFGLVLSPFVTIMAARSLATSRHEPS